MTTISTPTQHFDLECADDIDRLVEAVKTDLDLAESVMTFSPSGDWCIADGQGGYTTRSLSAAGLAGYRRALAAVDRAAVLRVQDERVEAALKAGAAWMQRLFGGSTGSTGQPWENETA